MPHNERRTCIEGTSGACPPTPLASTQKDPKFNPDKGSDITKLQKLRNQKNVNSQLAAEQADKARQIAAPSAGDAISGVIGAKQAYESFSKLKQSSGESLQCVAFLDRWLWLYSGTFATDAYCCGASYALCLC